MEMCGYVLSAPTQTRNIVLIKKGVGWDNRAGKDTMEVRKFSCP